MNKLSNILKIIFHSSNIILIFLYLFPGSILGWFFYINLKIQPQLTDNFFNISSNHFYAFFVLSIMGIFSYLKQQMSLLVFSIFVGHTHQTWIYKQKNIIHFDNFNII